MKFFKLAGKRANLDSVSSDKFPRPARRPKYSALRSIKLKPLRNYKKALKEYLNK